MKTYATIFRLYSKLNVQTSLVSMLKTFESIHEVHVKEKTISCFLVCLVDLSFSFVSFGWTVSKIKKSSFNR